MAKTPPDGSATRLLYHFCRLQRPTVVLPPRAFDRHLLRAYQVYEAKRGTDAGWEQFLANLYPLDWFVASACLEGDGRAWESLFASRAGRSDCLLLDALRARAVRLYPRDEERQDSAVTEFWSHLLVAESPGAVPVLARYDGQRPLVPWLIRVFQNWHISQLRQRPDVLPLPEAELSARLPPETSDSRWHESFRMAAREALQRLPDQDILLLGLRLRYRMSQREVAAVLGVHEGTVSRQVANLRDRCLDEVQARLVEEGWTGEDLSGLVLQEMGSVLGEEPRLSADNLAALLAARRKRAL
jgi:RNA polymerase sigma factor (sigma-70 family)